MSTVGLPADLLGGNLTQRYSYKPVKTKWRGMHRSETLSQGNVCGAQLHPLHRSISSTRKGASDSGNSPAPSCRRPHSTSSSHSLHSPHATHLHLNPSPNLTQWQWKVTVLITQKGLVLTGLRPPSVEVILRVGIQDEAYRNVRRPASFYESPWLE